MYFAFWQFGNICIYISYLGLWCTHVIRTLIKACWYKHDVYLVEVTMFTRPGLMQPASWDTYFNLDKDSYVKQRVSVNDGLSFLHKYDTDQ